MEIDEYSELGLVLTSLRIYRKKSEKTLLGLNKKFGDDAITSDTEHRIEMLRTLEEKIKKEMHKTNTKN